MSDASDRTAALALLIENLQPTVAPVLTTTATTGEVDKILDRNRRGRTWLVNTAYIAGDVVLPPIRNGHRYRVTVPGTSAAVDPGVSFWPTASGATFSEGLSSPALTWVEDGLQYENIYDVRRATYEGWRLKAQKATQLMTSGGSNFQQVYEHCIAMADRFRGVSVT